MLDERDPAQLARVVGLVAAGELSAARTPRRSTRDISRRARRSNAIVAQLGLRQISDSDALGEADRAGADREPESAVADYRSGKDAALRFLVGQVMKETRGQADATIVQELLEQRLEGPGR